MIKISDTHSNKRLHNWLIYRKNDAQILKNIHRIKGDLYDLGCGEAPYKLFLLQYAKTYTGVDWSNTTHNSGADVVSDLNDKFDVKNEVADTVVSFSVMEHLHNPQGFLNESYRIMRREGELIMQVPWQWWIHEAPHDYFRYTPYALRRMLSIAGFSDIKVEATSGFFTSITIKLNYFSLRFVRGPKPLKILIKICLIPFWTVGQLIAPQLDKLDRRWEAESQGYFVVAKKV